MSTQPSDTGAPVEPPPAPGAYVVMTPEMDLVQKGADMSGMETRVIHLDE